MILIVAFRNATGGKREDHKKSISQIHWQQEMDKSKRSQYLHCKAISHIPRKQEMEEKNRY